MQNDSIEFLDEFIKEMKKVMLMHNIEKGCNWKTENYDNLVNNLYEEIHEFEIKDDPQQELIDIANTSFILWARNKFFKKGV
jgi:type I site-specific restriction-modification system R (restriction) subunit